MKITDINIDYPYSFSSGIGNIKCSYEKLYLLFGDPKEIYSDKIDHEWTLVLENGDHINIYDWKIGKSYLGEEDGFEKEDISIWNVGSNNPSTLNFLNNLIQSDDWAGFEKTKLKMFMSNKLVESAIKRREEWV